MGAAVDTLTLSPISLSLKLGETQQITAHTIQYAIQITTEDFTVSSSNTSIATAEISDGSVKVTAIKAGQASITLTPKPTGAYPYYITEPASVPVTVTRAVYRRLLQDKYGNGIIPVLVDIIYPVGSIYMSATLDTAQKVHDALGGTWVAWGAGRVPVGVGSNGTTNYTTPEATGGSESHQHTYGFKTRGWYGTLYEGFELYDNGSWKGQTNATGPGNTTTRSGTDTGSNNAQTMTCTADTTTGDSRQPYITCYMWKRTA